MVVELSLIKLGNCDIEIFSWQTTLYLYYFIIWYLFGNPVSGRIGFIWPDLARRPLVDDHWPNIPISQIINSFIL